MKLKILLLTLFSLINLSSNAMWCCLKNTSVDERIMPIDIFATENPVLNARQEKPKAPKKTLEQEREELFLGAAERAAQREEHRRAAELEAARRDEELEKAQHVYELQEAISNAEMQQKNGLDRIAALYNITIDTCEIRKPGSTSPDKLSALYSSSIQQYRPITPQYVFGKPIIDE